MVFPRKSHTAWLYYPGLVSLFGSVASKPFSVRLLLSGYEDALAVTPVESMF